MSLDQELIKKLFEVAENIKGSPLSVHDKEKLIEKFNEEKGNAIRRSRISIEESLGYDKLTHFQVREKSYSSTNNLDILLKELQVIASDWAKKNK
jgi:hypothetical protein